MKVSARKAASSIVPIAGIAPIASIPEALSGLLLTTVTVWFLRMSSSASGLLMLPKEPVTIIFILIDFTVTKFSISQAADVAGSLYYIAGKGQKKERKKPLLKNNLPTVRCKHIRIPLPKVRTGA